MFRRMLSSCYENNDAQQKEQQVAITMIIDLHQPTAHVSSRKNFIPILIVLLLLPLRPPKKPMIIKVLGFVWWYLVFCRRDNGMMMEIT